MMSNPGLAGMASFETAKPLPVTVSLALSCAHCKKPLTLCEDIYSHPVNPHCKESEKEFLVTLDTHGFLKLERYGH